jgi:hypothetical protein
MIATHEPELKTKTIRKMPLSIGERFRANVQRLRREQSVSLGALAVRLTKLGQSATEDSVRKLLRSDSFPSCMWIELMSRALEVTEEEITAGIDI